MYPVALIIFTGLYLESKDTLKFVAPLAWCGLFVSIYHNLVYYKVIQVIVPCNETAPCTAQNINYFGFITIPLLSGVGFLFVVILNLYALNLQKKVTHEK